MAAATTTLLSLSHKLSKYSPTTLPTICHKTLIKINLPFPQSLRLLSPPIPRRHVRIRGTHPPCASQVSTQTSESEGFVSSSQNLKLFVGSLPFDCDGEKLFELFSRAGAVESAEVIYDLQTDKSRGFGFVAMSDLEGLERAIDMFNQYAPAEAYPARAQTRRVHKVPPGTHKASTTTSGRKELDGRQITVNKATPRGTKPLRSSGSSTNISHSHKIYVGNLPWRVDDAQLERIFGEHGKVIDAQVVYEKGSGRSRGFGFVRISTESKVDDVIAALDGKSLDGRIIRVDLAEQRQ